MKYRVRFKNGKTETVDSLTYEIRNGALVFLTTHNGKVNLFSPNPLTLVKAFSEWESVEPYK
jgi:hypothetical protein